MPFISRHHVHSQPHRLVEGVIAGKNNFDCQRNDWGGLTDATVKVWI